LTRKVISRSTLHDKLLCRSYMSNQKRVLEKS
jgi:hypothetical protein